MQKLVNRSGRHSKLATPHNFQRSTGYRVNVNEVKLVHCLIDYIVAYRPH